MSQLLRTLSKKFESAFNSGSSKPPLYQDAPPPFNAYVAASQKPNAQIDVSDLAEYDVVCCVDMSGSMTSALKHTVLKNGVSTEHLTTRSQYAKECVLSVVQSAAQFDDDGVTVAVFNNGYEIKNNVDEKTAAAFFAKHHPSGGTRMAEMLSEIIADYFERRKRNPKKTKRTMIIVITDGEASDKQELKEVIAAATKEMDNEEMQDKDLGILFMQIGKDPDATAFLKELDNLQTSENLAFDIVSTVNWDDVDEAGGILAAFLKAINE